MTSDKLKLEYVEELLEIAEALKKCEGVNLQVTDPIDVLLPDIYGDESLDARMRQFVEKWKVHKDFFRNIRIAESALEDWSTRGTWVPSQRC